MINAKMYANDERNSYRDSFQHCILAQRLTAHSPFCANDPRSIPQLCTGSSFLQDGWDPMSVHFFS